MLFFFFSAATTRCYGIYNTQYVELLASKQHHAIEELWTQGRSSETDANCDVKVQCICCKTYDNWKSRHPSEHKLLQESVAKQEGYEFLPDEKVVVLENGLEVEYTGVIHSTSCTDTATNHPYQCNPCHTLINKIQPQEL